ncbi:MAG: permease [Treponema sp.]
MWDFIQNEILGMKWLYVLIRHGVAAAGLSVESKIGGAVAFFLFDIIKISVLLCVLIFLISLIQSFFPPEKSRKIMGRFGGFGSRVIGALLGTVTPFCSCSSIPIFMGFTAAGLPLGVTFSFLISSPMVDLGSLVVLMSVFGWKTAVLYVVFGLVIAVAGGSLIERLHLEDEIADFIRNAGNCPQAELPEQTVTMKDRAKSAFDKMHETLWKLFPYILAGVALGAFIHNWIPERWISAALGNKNPFGVLLAVACGIPMYADIFGCIPIAEALLFKGAALGVVLSFMMAVTTLSLPSLVMLSKAVKPRLLAVFTAICIVGIVAAGYVFNAVQGVM